MKKYIYPLAITAAMFATTACSDDVVNDVAENKPDSQKEKIEFSMTDEIGGAITRSNTRAGFEAQTKIVMRMRSKDSGSNYRYSRTIAKAAAQASGKAYSTVSFDTDYIRYWDDAFGRNANLSVFAVAVPGKNDDDLLPASILSEPETSSSTFVNSTKWFTEATENEKTTTWTVKTSQQTTTTIANEDLVYSNNIQPIDVTPAGYDGVYTFNFTDNDYIKLNDNIDNINSLGDGCMKFQLKDENEPTGTGKFNKGHLIFKHALSRITINLIKGAGFTDTDLFAFTTNTDITLKSFPVKGVLNVEKGSWTLDASEGTSDITRIASMDVESGSTVAFKYMAQVLPGYVFKSGVSDNVMQFTIDNNTYYVTKDMVFNALTKDASNSAINTSEVENGNQITMKSGKNYVLTITVGKTKIESLTCTLVPWTDVNAENQTPSNSRISLNLLSASGSACENFDIYRLPEDASSITDSYDGTAWGGNYTDKATLTKNTNYETSKSWTTNWFFVSNSTYYHFRTVNTGTTIMKTDGQKDDYFEISAGAVADTDPHWGAPFKSGSNLKYDLTYGWSASDVANSQIAHAIGSTTDVIAITENHMMSNVYVVLKTVTGNGAVELYNATTKKGTTVTLTNFYKDGKVAMGTGRVSPVTTAVTSAQEITTPTETSADTYYKTKPVTGTSPVAAVSNQYSYAFVPQPLVRNSGAAVTDFVGITITTPDNNEYYVEKLSLINAESVGTESNNLQTASQPITQWYPGHKYIYTFTISKKGIESITCSLVDWTSVTGSNTDLNLEGVIPPATTGGSSSNP